MNKKTINKKLLKKLLPKRQKNSHKGSYGAVLNIAGSINYRGAAYLSSISALKAGCGYVTTACIEAVANSIANLTPDIVLAPLKEANGCVEKNEYKKILNILPKYQVLALGCGLSSIEQPQEEIEQFVKNLLDNISKIKTPVIIDADGLNIIAKLEIKTLPPNTILTPHPKELSRLIDIDVEKIQSDRIKYAQIAAKQYNAIVVLKGHNTIIANSEKVFLNNTGNSALSKAGSGDVLTGIISGFTAQGMEIFNSALCGVFVHGIAGEIASKNLSEYSVNASNLVDFIPFALKKLTF